MATPFQNLLDSMPKKRRDQVKVKKKQILAEVHLRELRRAVKLTQQQLAETLHINQAAISKMESQSDMYISTLRRVIKAMVGELMVIAEFPQGQVVIRQFEQD